MVTQSGAEPREKLNQKKDVSKFKKWGLNFKKWGLAPLVIPPPSYALANKPLRTKALQLNSNPPHRGPPSPQDHIMQIFVQSNTPSFFYKKPVFKKLGLRVSKN